MGASTLIPPMSTILELSNLRVERGNVVILAGIDWRVRRSEHWVVLGPNGCGKTSMLKALTGYLSPSSGSIRLLGEEYGQSDWRKLRLHIGIVTSSLQASIPIAEPALETVISGKYAQLDLWLKHTAADKQAALKFMRFVGADHLQKREWQYLSQGERQRILIARALMAKPRLLILDEPCSGLDPVAREEFLHFVNVLAKRRTGPSLILVTHHVEEIVPGITHALVLKSGAVFANGPKEKVVTTRTLTGAFGARLKVKQKSARYEAALS